MLSFGLPPGSQPSSNQINRSSPLHHQQLSVAKRVPLGELPVSKTGVVRGQRHLTYRPLPSPDKENEHALYTANRSRQAYQAYLIDQLQEIAHRLHRPPMLYRRARRRSFRYATSRRRQTFANHSSAMPHPRLSMPEISDDSGSEPDLSVLAMARARAVDLGNLTQGVETLGYDVHAQLEADDTSIEEDVVVEGVGEIEDTGEAGEVEEAHEEEIPEEPLPDPAEMGLKEISNLGRFTVSSHKHGSGVEELRSDDLTLYWQSDGPQPHKLTVYFIKRVGIRDLRFYVNYNEDESYTPTRIIFKSGTSENNLIEFAEMNLKNPVGWQQVSLNGAGGGPDRNTLVSYVLQMQILENHQNGKDTHLRGIKIYAFDTDSGQASGRENNPVEDVVDMLDHSGATRQENPDENVRLSGLARRLAETRIETGEAGFTIPDFMRDPEIR